MTKRFLLRPVQPEDEAFLFGVYASTRAEEMALVAWPEAQKQAFLRMQFAAQRQHYLAYYPRAEYHIIQRTDLVGGKVDVGRLIVERTGEVIQLIDIALLPVHRHDGIGTSLLEDLQSEGVQTGKEIRLHVERFNPALRLYERKGFVITGEAGPYWQMTWRPVAVGMTTNSGKKAAIGENDLGN